MNKVLSYYCDQREIILKGNCGFHLDFQNADYKKLKVTKI